MVLFAALLMIIVIGLLAVHFLTRFRRLDVIARNLTAIPAANRYKPMMRLLSDEDLRLVSHNRTLAAKLKHERRGIFRDYLRSLTRDYGRLLAGIRLAMVNSGVDRPDLAFALAKNQALFAFAVCRIEYRLWLHNAGLANVDVTALVNAVDTLRDHVNLATPALSPSH